jgi:hypothetical protein
LPIASRSSALMGSLWRPSPSAMKEVSKGWPSMRPPYLDQSSGAKVLGRPGHHHVGPTPFVRAPLNSGRELVAELHSVSQKAPRNGANRGAEGRTRSLIGPYRDVPRRPFTCGLRPSGTLPPPQSQ